MADTLIARIRHAQMLAAEQAVIDSIPKDLIDWMDKANADFAASGGCVCGSKLVGVHYLPCAYCDAHPFD